MCVCMCVRYLFVSISIYKMLLLLLRECGRRVGDCCETRTALNVVVVERFFFGIIIIMIIKKNSYIIYYCYLLIRSFLTSPCIGVSVSVFRFRSFEKNSYDIIMTQVLKVKKYLLTIHKSQILST